MYNKKKIVLKKGNYYSVEYKVRFSKRGEELQSIRKISGICYSLKKGKLCLKTNIKGVDVHFNIRLDSMNLVGLREYRSKGLVGMK